MPLSVPGPHTLTMSPATFKAAGGCQCQLGLPATHLPNSDGSCPLKQIKTTDTLFEPYAKMIHGVRGLNRLRQTRTSVKIGRNGPCPCGSGKKYKKCCA